MINLKSLVHIDRLAYPLYALLSPLLTWSKSPVSSSQGDDSFVIIKMLGIGSITRIFSTLRKHNVDLQSIYFLTLASNKHLCEVLEIPNVIFVKMDKWYQVLPDLWGAIRQIRRHRAVYIVDYERSSNLLGLFRGVATLFSSIGTISFYQINKDQRSGSDTRFSLKGRSINDLITLSLDYLPIKTESDSGKQTSLPRRTDTICVLVNVNASDYLPHRKYPLKNFARIISGLLQNTPEMEISLIGSTDEKGYVQSMIDDFFTDSTRVKNRCGEWSLQRLSLELEHTGLLITNDSGPMHLAAMKDTKTIVIWGPTTPGIFGYTDRPNVINLHSGRSCAPCFTYPKSKPAVACNGRIDCMRDIEPDAVLAAANKLLSQYQETA